MAKRGADKYLTDQNWEEEDEPEEAGKFLPASEDVLKNRTFKKAKRRIGPEGSSGAGAFTGFSGLTGVKSGNPNGFKGFNLAASTSKPFSLQFNSNTTSPSEASEPNKMEKPTMSKEVDDITTDANSEFNRHLSALNRSVSKWISQHVEKDPLCNLSPIFRDYQKHISDIEEKYGGNASQSDVSHESTEEEKEAPSKSTDTPDEAPVETPIAVATPPKNPFGSTPLGSTASPFKGFGSFPSKPSGGFSGFQFSSKMVGQSATQDPQSDSQASAEEYVPPKVESQMVQEEDAFYTKKCKLFYMKEGSYVDKGVGHIHLKPVPDSKKTQLIVRADTSLGNVLLNIVLNKAMPVARQGKNNVVISCVPNPPVDEKKPDEVVPMLVRVKTSEDADELNKILNEKKKEST